MSDQRETHRCLGVPLKVSRRWPLTGKGPAQRERRARVLEICPRALSVVLAEGDPRRMVWPEFFPGKASRGCGNLSRGGLPPVSRRTPAPTPSNFGTATCQFKCLAKMCEKSNAYRTFCWHRGRIISEILRKTETAKILATGGDSYCCSGHGTGKEGQGREVKEEKRRPVRRKRQRRRQKNSGRTYSAVQQYTAVVPMEPWRIVYSVAQRSV